MAVLASALQDDPEIRNTAITIMENFIEQMEKYNILDLSSNVAEINQEDLLLQHINISSKILGRKKLSPHIFLQILIKPLPVIEHNIPVSKTEQLELFLGGIFNNNNH